jgi:ribosomal protein S18 acetylase RimI-like enzyme
MAPIQMKRRCWTDLAKRLKDGQGTARGPSRECALRTMRLETPDPPLVGVLARLMVSPPCGAMWTIIGWRMGNAGCQIVAVRTAAELAAAKMLFRAYAASLEVDLGYQDFEAEMAAMPGKYAPPDGELLLALGLDGEELGCAGLRPMDSSGCCEMKRLYVLPEARGRNVGLHLVGALLAVAERIGYREIKLDTLPSMAAAQALYAKLGFEVIEPYYRTPVSGTVFMRRPIVPVDRT